MQKAAVCLEENRLARAAASSLGDLTAAAGALQQCNAALNGTARDFMLGGVTVLLLVTLALYLAMPHWRLRRGRLEPFTEQDDPDVAAELDRLSAEAGVQPAPSFVWNPLNSVPTGLAFGRAGRRHVGLSGGLVTRFFTDPPAFRAVVLHELAHIRNRDVDLTYLAVVVWYAFLAVSIVPVLPTLFDEDASTIWSLVWRLAALTALVYLTRSSVLRAREVYADVRASLGEPAGIRTVLRSAPARPRRLRDRLIGLHPDSAQRLAAVEDTDRLFELGLAELVGVGIAATIAYQQVSSLIGYYALESLSAMGWSALVFAPLAASVLVAGVWRGTFARLARGRRVGGAAAAGAALGVGFLLGQELSLASGVSDDDVILGLGSGNVLSAAIVVGGLALFGTWVATAAELWLPVSGEQSPRWVWLAGAGAAALVLTVAMGIFFLARSVRAVIDVSFAVTASEHAETSAVIWATPRPVYQFVRDPLIGIFVHRLAVWPALVTLWAFPLTALLFRRRRAPHTVAWGTLGMPPVVLQQRRLRFGRAALIGLSGAAAVLVAALALRVGLHFGAAEATRYNDDFLLVFYVWTVSIGLVAMAVVAAVTAATCRVAGFVLGLFAAALTGTAAAVTLFAYPSLASCVDVLAIRQAGCTWVTTGAFARQSFEQMFAQGTLVALGGAGVGSLYAAAVHWRRAGTPEPVGALDPN